MHLQISNDIFGYWNSIRGNNPAPLRSQIDPAVLGRGLANLFILEGGEMGDISFRLAGQRICDLFGRDLRATDFANLWAEIHQHDILDLAADAMQNLSPVLINASGYSTGGHQASFEIVLLPIRSSEDKHDRLLGAISAIDAASWLELVPLDFLAVESSHDLLQATPADVTEADHYSQMFIAGTGHTGTLAQVTRRLMSYF